MATLLYKCMYCGWKGSPNEVAQDQDDGKFSICPKCGDEDIFEQRFFICLDCGFEAEQVEFFPGLCADEDPSEMPGGKLHSEHVKNRKSCRSNNWKQIG